MRRFVNVHMNQTMELSIIDLFLTNQHILDNYVTYGRHRDTVHFCHLRARTQRLHGSAVNAFARERDELPEHLRSGKVLNNWIHSLRSHLCRPHSN